MAAESGSFFFTKMGSKMVAGVWRGPLQIAALFCSLVPSWADARPNLVYILTDDTDVLLGSGSFILACARWVWLSVWGL